MGGRRIALLGSMLLLAAALSGCAESTDSVDDGDDVATAQSPIQAAPQSPIPPGGHDGPGAPVATTGSNPSSQGCKCEDPEPSPWVPGANGVVVGDEPDDTEGGGGEDNNPGMKQADPEPAPWTTSQGAHAIRFR
jgi:hypothetical protein